MTDSDCRRRLGWTLEASPEFAGSVVPVSCRGVGFVICGTLHWYRHFSGMSRDWTGGVWSGNSSQKSKSVSLMPRIGPISFSSRRFAVQHLIDLVLESAAQRTMTVLEIILEYLLKLLLRAIVFILLITWDWKLGRKSTHNFPAFTEAPEFFFSRYCLWGKSKE